jgi:hypothetical protein
VYFSGPFPHCILKEPDQPLKLISPEPWEMIALLAAVFLQIKQYRSSQIQECFWKYFYARRYR